MNKFAVKYAVFALVFIIVIHIFLLANISFFPNSELFIYPYLTNSGLLPYKQILDQHFPGLMFLPLNFNNLGMTTPKIAHFWQLGAVVLTQVLIYVNAKRLLKSKYRALLANLLFLLLQPFLEGWIQWLDIFLPIFLLSVSYLLIKYQNNTRDLRNLLIAGFVLGLGIVFKQVLIPLAVLLIIYIYLITKDVKKTVYFGSAILVPVLLMLLYLFSIGVLSDFWYWTVIYNLTVFAEHGTKEIPSFSHLVRFIYVYLPALFVIAWKYKKKQTKVLGIILIGSMASVMARFDFVHLQPSLPFVVLLVTYGFFKFSKRKLAYLLFSLYLLVFVYWGVDFYKALWGGGYKFFEPDVYLVADEINIRTQEREHIFIYGAIPHLYQMTNTLPAGDVFIFQFPWFMLVAEDRVLDGIIKDNPNLVVVDKTVTLQGQRLIDYAPKIDNYIEENYVVDKRVGNTEIMLKKK